MMSRLADWRFNREITGLSINWHIHEAVQSVGDLTCTDPEKSQYIRKMTRTGLMRLLISIDNSKRIFEQEVRRKSCRSHVSSIILNIMLLWFEYIRSPSVRYKQLA